jgi:tetratricopeptide (TPR) repeat protein
MNKSLRRKMKLSVWLNVVAALYAVTLAGQTAPEQTVGLILTTQSAKLLRANTSLELTAKTGDILFTGDSLRGDGSEVVFLYCPGRSTNTLSSDGAVKFEQTRLRMTSGRVTAKSAAASCFMPSVVRVAVASQQHYGLSITRPLELNQPGATFPERLLALAPEQRTALIAELRPIDQALAANGRDPVARIARAAVFEKYSLRADAAIEYRRILQEWPDAVWALGKLFALEDRPAPQKLEPAAPAAEGQTYALLVGVSNYRSERITPLVYAARDASLFEDFLKSPRGGDLADSNIKLLMDNQGTTAAIRLSIASFLKAKASRNDTVLLFIAAHGTVDTKTGQAYVITHDADPEDLAGTALSMADLEDLFRKELAGVRRALLFLDTCHSGQLGSVAINPINDAVAPLSRVKGEVFTFMASGKDEQSEEGPQYGGGHGAFSYFVVDALNGSADLNNDGNVSFNEFVDYVRDMVRKSTRQPQHARETGDLGKTRMSEIAKPGLTLARWPTGAATAASSSQTTRGLGQQAANLSLPEPEGLDRAITELQARRSTLTPAAYLDEENKFRVALENKGRETLLRYLRGEQAPQNRSQFTSGAAYFAAAQRLSPESLLLESEKVFCQGRAALFEPKDFNRAADLLERAVRLDPVSAYSYNALGIAYLQRAAYREAEGAFRDAIKRAPRWIYPRHNLALTLSESGVYAAAEREYREAVRLEPRYSYLHYSLGALLQKLGRGKEAESEYLAAIRIDPKHAEAYTGLGVVRAARGKSSQAEQDYQTAIRLNPKLPAAAHDLALLYVKDKKIDLAIRTWVENLERNPNFTPSRISLAMVYRNQDRLDDAVTQYEAVLAASPNYAAARMALHETLGDRRKAENKLDEARAEYQQALAIAAGGGDRKRIGRKLRK